MKPTMLLALSFLHFALITIAIFLGGAVVAQQTPATVLDIYGEPVRANAEYYIYEPRDKSSPELFRVIREPRSISSPKRFRVIGMSTKDNRAYLYDCENAGTAVIISQGDRAELQVDTALEIKFKLPINYTRSHYWKVDLNHPDVARNYFLSTGGHNEGYIFKLAQNEAGKRHHLYYWTYTSVSLFCDNCKSGGIRLLDSYFVADTKEQPFQFVFVPVE